jgi:hypothetical protein
MATRVAQHQMDAYWIIAMWKALHGDETNNPETIGVQAIAGLAGYLQGATVEESAVKQMAESLKKIGITLTEQNGAAGAQVRALVIPAGKTNNGRLRCFGFGSGHTICVPEVGDPAR